MAVVLAARTFASTASRVSFAAIVRLRRAVDADGDFAAVARVVVRLRGVVVRLRAVLDLRAVLERFAGVVLVVEVLVSAMWSIKLLVVRSVYRT
jgi:hypothetical protein